MNYYKFTYYVFLPLFISLFVTSCKKENKDETVNETVNETEKNEPALVFKVKINETQERLDNLVQSADLPNGHSAQTPRFNKIAAHYI